AGASPELLVRRAGARAFAQPMAGSVARGASDSEDERLADTLVQSTKDADEHRVVSQFVVEALRPFSAGVSARGPEGVRVTNIQHLATSVSADLNHPAADALTLAAALHPTPAVGGRPRGAADAVLGALRGRERGWWGGAGGLFDGRVGL